MMAEEKIPKVMTKFAVPAILFLPKLFDLTGLLISQPVADVATTMLTLFLTSRTFRELRTLQAGMEDEIPVPFKKSRLFDLTY